MLIERMWNEMDALPAAPTFPLIFFSFFLFFSIFLCTMNQKAAKNQRIFSMCFSRDNFELKIQPITKVIGHSILENGWRWWIYFQSVKATWQNWSIPNLSADNFRDLNQKYQSKNFLKCFFFPVHFFLNKLKRIVKRYELHYKWKK